MDGSEIKIGKFNTPFRKDSTYENIIMDALPLPENALYKPEMEYHGKFRHTLVRIQHITLISRIEIFTQPVA